ncbi:MULTISPECIES: tannase/feruloyl esterase family alpha/beta hydrolase [unclassified Burkholderia]|uniref:tannase/feruloyl esterase family alpha/beta hydrolase n=1 Tax=unclassified Burkholderia TaxID=2613784 RepID=UPI002AAFBF9B|nr:MULTISPECIES: tannase/feruloyl esterase family alpha/beta hydrolase [unclassified Burkholderia]
MVENIRRIDVRILKTSVVSSLIVLLILSISVAGCTGDGSTSGQEDKPTIESMCTPRALQQVMPQGVTVKDIPNLLTYLPVQIRATKGGVSLLAANALGDGAPSYCVVTGSYVTNAATGKTANFAAVLPAADKWNGKYLQIGCGGNCGNVFDAGIPTPAHVKAGYAIWQTDDGHVDGAITATGNSVEADPSWAIKSPGVPDTEAINDYLYRAVHTLAVVGPQATALLYKAGKVKRSYFLGCSDGGREAMVEATKYPGDFDGIVAGAPYDPLLTNINFMTRALTQLRSSGAALSAAQLKLVANTVLSACDSRDGVADGLVQNPNACDFNPRRDLPICPSSVAASDSCLTSDQIDSVSAMLSTARQSSGAMLAAGWSPLVLGSDEAVGSIVFPSSPLPGPDVFGLQPYMTSFTDWSFANYTIRDLVFAGASSYDGTISLGQSFGRANPADSSSFHITFADRAVGAIDSAMKNGRWNDASAMAAYIKRGGKLFLYQGLNDPFVNVNNTIQYYINLAEASGGYGALQNNVRMFLAPGMDHCVGGYGPNAFVNQYNAPGFFSGPAVPFDADHDALAAIDAWVESGKSPESITATKYKDDVVSEGIARTMPLCPFPAVARYSGKGSVTDAANWSCPTGDRSLLVYGPGA